MGVFQHKRILFPLTAVALHTLLVVWVGMWINETYLESQVNNFSTSGEVFMVWLLFFWIDFPCSLLYIPLEVIGGDILRGQGYFLADIFAPAVTFSLVGGIQYGFIFWRVGLWLDRKKASRDE